MLDFGLEVRKFKLQLYNNIHFQANTIRKECPPLSLQAPG